MKDTIEYQFNADKIKQYFAVITSIVATIGIIGNIVITTCVYMYFKGYYSWFNLSQKFYDFDSTELFFTFTQNGIIVLCILCYSLIIMSILVYSKNTIMKVIVFALCLVIIPLELVLECNCNSLKNFLILFIAIDLIVCLLGLGIINLYDSRISSRFKLLTIFATEIENIKKSGIKHIILCFYVLLIMIITIVFCNEIYICGYENAKYQTSFDIIKGSSLSNHICLDKDNNENDQYYVIIRQSKGKFHLEPCAIDSKTIKINKHKYITMNLNNIIIERGSYSQI